MTGTMETVGVVGLGRMGFDIAFLYARSGYRTLIYDVAEQAMRHIEERSNRAIARLERRNRISKAEAARVKNGLVRVSGPAAMARAQLVTEAVAESLTTKKAVYRALRDGGFSGILTTNTSSLPRASLIADGDYPSEKFAAAHFFNPVLYTQMVEVVRGDMSEPNYAALTAFLSTVGRKPVLTRDISGFVSNSVLMFYAVTALRLLECGAGIESIDGTAKGLGALPPLFSLDSWKPSIVEHVTRAMCEFRGDDFLRSAKLLSALARRNPLFYVGEKPNPAIYDLVDNRRAAPAPAEVELALLTSVRVAAARTVELGESPATVDLIAVEGLKFAEPPLATIDALGAARVLQDLQRLNDALSLGMPAPLLLRAMSEEKESFYKNGHANPWLSARCPSG
ncbi:MAG TPA: 3-hydroxyacyl-CoA dehydrogenase NAD-binding domain-containing protein [Candidatus Eisenbacteria bacterium]|nr:3-hydroxyacyl-CoA dehydrogenase NAD-binding domain-containing protein [Candidatus Eisenbacteria bacterium]